MENLEKINEKGIIIENVIFLGAGASKADKAPLQRELLNKFFDYVKNDNFPQYLTKSQISRLKKYFEKFYGINFDVDELNKQFPTFEEVLGVLDLSLLRDESFKYYENRPNKSHAEILREDLIMLIANILKKELINSHGIHQDFINDLAKMKDMLKKTGFVSLNYDILIDNALDDYSIDYGVEIIQPQFQKEKNVKLLKLHGSLNWQYCTNCVKLALTPRVKSALKLDECPLCKRKRIPIIIPPTFFKVMSNYYLQRIWHETERMLSYAKRIIFCGYSFPDADIHIKYLLKRVEINFDNSPDIYIINKPSIKPNAPKSKQSEVLDEAELEEPSKSEFLRYTRFFKERNKIHFMKFSFEDFCKEEWKNILI